MGVAEVACGPAPLIAIRSDRTVGARLRGLVAARIAPVAGRARACRLSAGTEAGR